MVNRDDMIAYLLHQMPDAERTAFAERWFTEPELYEQLQMLEAELLDDYAHGKVSRSQHRRIERYLLSSEFQQRKMAFAVALQEALPQPKVLRVPWTAIVAAVLVVSLGMSLWLGLQNRKLQKEVARLERAPLTQSIAQAKPDGVYTVALPADTLRGASTENAVRLPAGIGVLRLELELPRGEKRMADSATLLAGSQTLWSEGQLRRSPKAMRTLRRVPTSTREV